MNRYVAGVIAAGLLLVACDEGGSPVVEPEPGGVTSSTVAVDPNEVVQPALWPAAGVVLATPEEAAVGFLDAVIGAGLPGQFRAGDPRSGEIDVIFTGEGGGGTEIVRSTLLLRQLGAAGGWFVIAATSPNAAITAPAAGAAVPAGPLSVTGLGRGFEGSVSVRALRAGVAGEPLSEAVTTAGSQATPEPYDVELDLSGAQPGEVVTLLVRGGVGLETDPGDFGAIPVVIEG